MATTGNLERGPIGSGTTPKKAYPAESKNPEGVKYMELALNCMFLQGQETPPSQSSIGYEGSMTQSSYNGFRWQETDFFKGSTTQVLYSLHAPTLSRCCQRSQYKFNTNS
jgi:hypothetical protein